MAPLFIGHIVEILKLFFDYGNANSSIITLSCPVCNRKLFINNDLYNYLCSIDSKLYNTNINNVLEFNGNRLMYTIDFIQHLLFSHCDKSFNNFMMRKIISVYKIINDQVNSSIKRSKPQSLIIDKLPIEREEQTDNEIYKYDYDEFFNKTFPKYKIDVTDHFDLHQKIDK